MPWINVDLCSSDIHQFYLINGKQPAPDLLSCELSLETFLLTWIGMLFVKIISGGLACKQLAGLGQHNGPWRSQRASFTRHRRDPRCLKMSPSLITRYSRLWGGMRDTFTYGFTSVMSREDGVVWSSEVSDLSVKVMIMEFLGFLSSPHMVSPLWWRRRMKIDSVHVGTWFQIQFGKLEIYLKSFSFKSDSVFKWRFTIYSLWFLLKFSNIACIYFNARFWRVSCN